LLFAVLLIQAGCSEEATPPTGPELVSVHGTVTRIVDDTPVDGGVQVDVELVDGETETLYLPSFWIPPTEEEEKVYQVIKQLRIGDRVEAVGERTEFGIKLRYLEKL